MSRVAITARGVRKLQVGPDDCVEADDLKPHQIAVACERWHMGDPLGALAATLGTNPKQLALAFLLAGLTPDRVGIGQRTGRWGRAPGDADNAPVTTGSPFWYALRPKRPMVPYVLFGEDIRPFNQDSLVTKVDDLHRAGLPLDYIRALTGADEALVRARVAALRRQGVRHTLATLAELDADPLAAVRS